MPSLSVYSRSSLSYLVHFTIHLCLELFSYLSLEHESEELPHRLQGTLLFDSALIPAILADLLVQEPVEEASKSANGDPLKALASQAITTEPEDRKAKPADAVSENRASMVPISNHTSPRPLGSHQEDSRFLEHSLRLRCRPRESFQWRPGSTRVGGRSHRREGLDRQHRS